MACTYASESKIDYICNYYAMPRPLPLCMWHMKDTKENHKKSPRKERKMSRKLLITLALMLHSIAALALGESPQQLINSIDESLPNLRRSVRDSIKNTLSIQYVSDFRTIGRSAAYDSLQHRIRVLKLSNEHNTSDTLATAANIEPPMSEIDKMKKENESLRNEIAVLKYGNQPEPEMTPLEKRTWWIVRQLVKQNNEMADTLWPQLRDSTLGATPGS